MNKCLQRYVSFTLTLTAFLAVVAIPDVTGNFKEFVGQIIGFLNLATIALVSLAVAGFFWSVVRNLWGYGQGNTEEKEKLQKSLFWGVIIIFVMVSLWGIIAILQQTLRGGFY